MTERLVIAIDGPSGSGKSSTAKGVASALGLAYLDTGAMYRAVTCAYLDAGVTPANEAGVIDATTSARLEISTDASDQWVRVNGADVTQRIREPEISANVSAVSTVDFAGSPAPPISSTSTSIPGSVASAKRRGLMPLLSTGSLVAFMASAIAPAMAAPACAAS